MEPDEELIQITERQLADAEEAYRREPSDANQRRIMKAWSAVREARGTGDDIKLPFRGSSPDG
ncbi:MAG TPA: hypothetical protein VHV28_07770 [Solirubrobacteraceae bacterium]|nr:hypothetical protein [Solirubrobacteraceae bacterium]